jgi:hypothetical protein
MYGCGPRCCRLSLNPKRFDTMVDMGKKPIAFAI